MDANPYLNQKFIEFPLSKFKLTLILLGALCFVGTGIWLVSKALKAVPTFPINRMFLLMIGFASILFFGICTVAILLKLFQKIPGIIIDANGITDHSSGISSGLIKWDDITHIDIVEVSRQKLIMLYVVNPDEYIQRHSNFLKRKASLFNYQRYGTPLGITTNDLKCTTQKLHDVLKSNWEQHHSLVFDAV
ncbi:STM3941 family protein [Mucilaginibacter arboris]|uniref:Uncharacterized protein n=1 Tax=Mucilaginibacter arboris TaxID=2682090 RepID=A0A7K1SYJ0_9SPHI|nr:STM3941 family protein [Mucilaginibacter arboris]MVN22385.1 hypothetical protein [Mucilaginibacter arboris]